MRLTRRELLAAAAASSVAARPQPLTTRPKLAAVVTTYFKWAHAQHLVDRFLEGYGWNGEFHHPPIDMVGLYVDQVGADDLSRDRARRFPQMKIYPTIAEALTLGGSKLAVDAVLLVGEHGRYPRNEKGQTLFPRYQFFQQIVKVFRDSGRSVPVFSDKHLSWNWDWAREMYDTSRAMQFAFMAGSSEPVAWRTPSVDMPMGARVREALAIYNGNVDSYDFHCLETIQCLVERRKGGESGVKWLQAYRGEKFWQALQEGVWPRDLLQAAFCRNMTLLPARKGYNQVIPSPDDMRRMVRNPVAYCYEHEDGLRSTMLLLNGLVESASFAARLDDRAEIFSLGLYSPKAPLDTVADVFSPLVNSFEKMFLTGKPTYPVERTLLTTGLVAAGIESLYRGQVRYETPHLAIRYQPTAESTFRRT